MKKITWSKLVVKFNDSDFDGYEHWHIGIGNIVHNLC